MRKCFGYTFTNKNVGRQNQSAQTIEVLINRKKKENKNREKKIASFLFVLHLFLLQSSCLSNYLKKKLFYSLLSRLIIHILTPALPHVQQPGVSIWVRDTTSRGNELIKMPPLLFILPAIATTPLLPQPKTIQKELFVFLQLQLQHRPQPPTPFCYPLTPRQTPVVPSPSNAYLFSISTPNEVLAK